jgi:hypothetical protein
MRRLVMASIALFALGTSALAQFSDDKIVIGVMTHWTDDTFSLAQGTAAALLKQDLKSWYFLTADYAFGHDLEKDAARLVETRDGKVIGSALCNYDIFAFALNNVEA